MQRVLATPRAAEAVSASDAVDAAAPVPLVASSSPVPLPRAPAAAATAETSPSPSAVAKTASELGRILVKDVLVPTLDRMASERSSSLDVRGGAGQGDKQADALALIRKGWTDLAEADPEGAWDTVKGLLDGVKG